MTTPGFKSIAAATDWFNVVLTDSGMMKIRRIVCWGLDTNDCTIGLVASRNPGKDNVIPVLEEAPPGGRYVHISKLNDEEIKVADTIKEIRGRSLD